MFASCLPFPGAGTKDTIMQLTKAVPALPVRDGGEAAAFYRDRLGFSVLHEEREYVIVARDAVELHLWLAHDESWRMRGGDASIPIATGAESFLAGTASCRIEIQEIDVLYDQYRDSGVLYDADTVVESRPWGTREFSAIDLERNLLTFYEKQ